MIGRTEHEHITTWLCLHESREAAGDRQQGRQERSGGKEVLLPEPSPCCRSWPQRRFGPAQQPCGPLEPVRPRLFLRSRSRGRACVGRIAVSSFEPDVHDDRSVGVPLPRDKHLALQLPRHPVDGWEVRPVLRLSNRCRGGAQPSVFPDMRQLPPRSWPSAGSRISNPRSYGLAIVAGAIMRMLPHGA